MSGRYPLLIYSFSDSQTKQLQRLSLGPEGCKRTCECARGSHHMWLLPRLALRAGLATVAGLVEELVLATAGIFSIHQHAAQLRTQQEERPRRYDNTQLRLQLGALIQGSVAVMQSFVD